MSAPTMPLIFFFFFNGCVLFIRRAWPFKILLYFHCWPPTPRLPTVLEPVRVGGELLSSDHCSSPSHTLYLGRVAFSILKPARPSCPRPWALLSLPNLVCPSELLSAQTSPALSTVPSTTAGHCPPLLGEPHGDHVVASKARQVVGVQIPAGPLGSCVALGSLLHLSASWDGNSNRCCVRACLWRGCRD